MISYFFF